MNEQLMADIGIQSLLKLAPEATTFLDLGCGKGAQSYWAAIRGLQVTAIDRRGPPPKYIRGMGGVAFLEKDLHEWVPEGQWDIVLARNVLQFLEHTYVLKEFLPRLVEHLRPQGFIEILTFAPNEVLETPSKYTAGELALSLRPLTILKHQMFEYDGKTMQGKKHHFQLTWVRARKM